MEKSTKLQALNYQLSVCIWKVACDYDVDLSGNKNDREKTIVSQLVDLVER